MSKEITAETQVNFQGKKYTIETFAIEFLDGDKDEAKRTLELFIRKGAAQILDLKTPAQKQLDKIADEELIKTAADAIVMEDEMAKDAKAYKKREGRLVYSGAEIPFEKYTDAVKFVKYCNETLRLKNINVTPQESGGTLVTVREITDGELNTINKYYTGVKVTKVAQETVSNAVESATKTVDFAAQNIVTPMAQIGLRGGASILKSLTKVGAKLGATAINTTSQTVIQARDEIVSDPDVIQAANTLINAKDAVKRKTLGLNTNSAIKIIS